MSDLTAQICRSVRHYVLVTTLYDEVGRRRPDAVVRRGGETFVEIDAAEELISEAERQGIRILGLEGVPH